MSSLNSTLREAADQNNQLLSILRQTDFAPTSLKQNTSYIADLKSQISSTTKELDRLHKITEDERKDHVKYRDSNVKRYLHKMGGSKGQEKFASKSEKEEKDFLEAWQKEQSTKDSRNELQQALDHAEKDRANLESDAARHDNAQSELDALYNSIFSGPTPEIPQEDQMEQSVQHIREHYNTLTEQIDVEKKALSALSTAEQLIKSADGSIENALSTSRVDMFGGGTFTDLMERDALAQTQSFVTATLRQISAARKFQPQIREITEITIDQGHFLSDMMFDSVFTDMAQHDRIKNSKQQIVAAGQQIRAQSKEQKQRVDQVNVQIKQAEDDLENARKELQRIRAEAFGRLAEARGSEGAPPPQYQAV